MSIGRHRSRAGTKAAGKDTGLQAGIGTEGSIGARVKQNYVIGIEAEAETAANVIPISLLLLQDSYRLSTLVANPDLC